jgi:hypothetical protein
MLKEELRIMLLTEITILDKWIIVRRTTELKND